MPLGLVTTSCLFGDFSDWPGQDPEPTVCPFFSQLVVNLSFIAFAGAVFSEGANNIEKTPVIPMMKNIVACFIVPFLELSIIKRENIKCSIK